MEKRSSQYVSVDIIFTWASQDSWRQLYPQNCSPNATHRCTFCGASNADRLSWSDRYEPDPGTLESQRHTIYSKAIAPPGLSFSSVKCRLFQRHLLVFCRVWRFSSARDLLSVLHPVTGRKGAGTCGEVTLQCDSRTVQVNDYILAGIDPGLWNKGHVK